MYWYHDIVRLQLTIFKEYGTVQCDWVKAYQLQVCFTSQIQQIDISITMQLSSSVNKTLKAESRLKYYCISLVPRPLPDFISQPRLQDKIWEWPGNEATIV